MAEIRRYEEMKDSGIEWIGEIPLTWKMKRLKVFTSYNDETLSESTDDNFEFDYVDIGSVEYGKGIIQFQHMKFKDAPSRARRLVKNDDVIISTVRTYLKAIAIITDMVNPVVVSTGFIVLRANKKHIVPQFLNYAVLSDAFISMIEANSVGISYPAITASSIINLSLPIPPLSEQQAIADYLDSRCSQIDKIIEEAKKSIEDYKALKAAVIQEAVTKGLNPDVEMKDSGIEEIGMIPKHWAVKKVKHVATSISKGNGITKEQVFEDGDIQCVRYGEIYSKYEYEFTSTYSKTKAGMISSPKYICNGDILFAGTGELVEEIGKNVVYLGDNPCLAGGDIVVMKHEQNPVFLNYVLGCSSSQKQKSEGKAKLKVVHISGSNIGNILITVPPLIEQIEIGNYLNKKVNQLNTIVSEKTKLIVDLEFYKKSLIYEVVTGKRKVT